MKGTLDRYLDRVMAVADLRDESTETRVREELHDHLIEKVDELESEGYERAEALVKAIEDHGNPMVVGYRLRPWRFIDVRLRGTARGVIAVGPRAVGVVAIGGLATGVIACGGLAAGVVSFGGLALALFMAWGGLACGALAYGGLAIGLLAFGGMAVGGVAAGGSAAGLWVPGAGTCLWSYFNWTTVPDWLRPLGERLSFDGTSPAEQATFWRRTIGYSVIFYIALFTLLAAQMILMKKEYTRVKRVLPEVGE